MAIFFFLNETKDKAKMTHGLVTFTSLTYQQKKNTKSAEQALLNGQTKTTAYRGLAAI